MLIVVNTTIVTGFAVVPVYGFTFSLTDNLPIILSRSRADILRQYPAGFGRKTPGDDFEF